MYTDPIADMLTRIRNAYRVGKLEVRMPYSKVKENIAGVLEEYQFIGGYSMEGEGVGHELVIQLDYDEQGRPRIEEIRRISRPSLRQYRKAKELKPVRDGYGIAIVSTNQGIMSDIEARKLSVGGEVIAEVW